MAPGGGPSLGLLSGTQRSPCHATEPLKVRDSFSEQHATVGPGIAHIHTVHGLQTHPVLGVGLVGMPAVCTVGPRVNADNGRSDVPPARTQESASLRKRVLCTRRVKRPSWVYYVLGAAVKTDQKSRAAQRHCWDCVGIRGNI